MQKYYEMIIRMVVKELFPVLPNWHWIRAQIWQESRFNPEAVSNAGAMGMMQIMPFTWKDLIGKHVSADPFHPFDNIFYGVKYMADLFDDFAEIPNTIERLKFALASYNCGKGYVNHALALARQKEGLPFGYRGWIANGSKGGKWQTWDFASQFLDKAYVKGKLPDIKQVTGYISHITKKYAESYDD